jgi:hypothetical protein
VQLRQSFGIVKRRVPICRLLLFDEPSGMNISPGSGNVPREKNRAH